MERKHIHETNMESPAVCGGRVSDGCVTGFAHAKERDYFCRRLIDWAYGHKSPAESRKSSPKRKSSGRKSTKKSRSK